MEILGATTQPCFFVDDELLDFTLDDGEGEDPTNSKGAASASYSSFEPPPNLAAADFGRRTQSPLFPEFEEEELEWLSNKDAFPPIETCFGIFSDNPDWLSDSQSSILVLDNSSKHTNSTPIGSLSYPVGARSKRRQKRVSFSNYHFPWPERVKRKKNGIRCLHCHTDETPQWRAGPMGPKTLCNACGVRYKSGRLLPEYMPANSPMFCSEVHSNSHKKVVEMRRQKLGNHVLNRIGYGE